MAFLGITLARAVAAPLNASYTEVRNGSSRPSCILEEVLGGRESTSRCFTLCVEKDMRWL